jgi:hypothetical protein
VNVIGPQVGDVTGLFDGLGIGGDQAFGGLLAALLRGLDETGGQGFPVGQAGVDLGPGF